MASLAKLFQSLRIKPATSIVRNITSKVIVQKVSPPLILNGTNHWIWRQNDKVELPLINPFLKQIEFPLKWIPPVEEPLVPQNDLSLPPTTSSEAPKEAARLIVIRRKKMKKHKLKKLRKRMKYEWAKKRQRREWKKEKDFQAVLIQQCKDAEGFSAEKYVEERLAKYNEAVSQSNAVKIRKTPTKNPFL